CSAAAARRLPPSSPPLPGALPILQREAVALAVEAVRLAIALIRLALRLRLAAAGDEGRQRIARRFAGPRRRRLRAPPRGPVFAGAEEHTSELQAPDQVGCRPPLAE